MADEIMTLAADFPPVDHDAWLGAVDVVLRGRPFEKVLQTTLDDGIVIEPLYTLAGETDHAEVPGAGVSRRASNPLGITAGWDIRQRVTVLAEGEANRVVLRELEKGATSVELDLTRCVEAVDMAGVLDGVLIDLATVALRSGGDGVVAARSLLAVAEAKGVAPDTVLADLGCDPVGSLAATGTAGAPIVDAIAAGAALAAEMAGTHAKVRTMRADSSPYAHAGASAATELAALVSTGVAYLRALTAAGLPVDVAVGQILLTTTVDSDQFLSIAKLRALRLMWATVTAESGAADAPARVQAVTSEAVLSTRDPWVNMLRTTVGAMAAAVGGADVITVRPFDAAIGLSDELGRRIARNTQLILQMESNLHRVIDPAGGSWYIEQLTDQLAAAAWSQFQELEAAGGITAALAAGSIQQRIADTWATHRKAIATRRQTLTGVSEFADLGEDAVVRPALPAVAVSGTDIEPLPLRRPAAEYERIRAAGEAGEASIFLANLGPGADHTARATFAKNMFEAGGIATIGNDGFSDDASVAAAFTASGSRLAIICSSDAAYAERVATVAPALRAAGAERIYLAGNPGDKRDEYERGGVDEFVFIGCDVLAALEGALVALGIDTTGGQA